MSAATAMRLVPSSQVPRALSIFNAGNALATVIAAPLGAWLGTIIGWRGAFFCLVPVAIIAFAWQWLCLPSLPAKSTGTTGEKISVFSIFSLFKRRTVTLGMLGISLFFMGQFTLFTYLRPFLETATQLDIATITLILLVIGISGFIGTALIGLVLKRGFYSTLIIIPVLMAGIALMLPLLNHWTAMVVLLLGFWGLIATAAPVGWWSWVPRTFPKDAEAGGGLMVAMIQLAIAFGSTLGGLLFDHRGYQATFIASALLLLLSATLVALTARSDKP